MSAELGNLGGAVGGLAGTAPAFNSRLRAPWWRVRASEAGAARLMPSRRREKSRAFAVLPQAASVSEVRRLLWSTCRAWHVAEFGDCVAACASELVTNAIVHASWPGTAGGLLRVVIAKSPRVLAVEVCDPDPEWPCPREPVRWDALDWGTGGSAGESGLGLHLVRIRLAELGGEFGCVSGTRGKIVYFVLPLPRRTRRDAAVRGEGGAR